MIECQFSLNGQKMSRLIVGSQSFPAFSGRGSHTNRLVSSCLLKEGPIPPGIYYILDRQSGGVLGSLRDLFTGRYEWFALYAEDERIDDEVMCDKVRRGYFRLHPKGALGRSEGCIVINHEADFRLIRSIFKNANQVQIPGLGLKAYGRLTVR